MPGRRRFHRHRAVAERLGLESQRVQLLGDARVFDLLRGAQADHQGHQQPLALDAALGALGQHLLEQNSLVRHVLVDDPQPVASRGDDEAVVDLAQRPQIGERVQTFGIERLGVGEQRPMSVGDGQSSGWSNPAEPVQSRIAARARRAAARTNSGSTPGIGRRRCRRADGREVHALDALAELRIRQPGSRLRRRGRGNIRRRTLGHQNFANGIADEIVDHRSVPEPHFGLGRMHVHVDFFGVAIQKQQREGITRRRHQVVIRGRNRVQQQAVPY